jgi:hypothetical protein
MISDRYRNFMNSLRARNGLKPIFPAPGAATPGPPDAVDATDTADDGLGDGEARDAAEFIKRSYYTAGGGDDDEDEDVGDDTGDDDEDEFSSLGALARPTRRLMMEHFKAKLESADADREKASAEAKRVADVAAFMRAAAKATGVIKK